MNNITHKNVRDFLYVDVPTLYSLYSQVFEGITDKITEEKIIQAITSNVEGVPLSPARNETQSTDTSRRVESYVLHDHMYNRLEEQIAPSIIDASKVSPEDVKAVFTDSSLVKVTGRAEIEDYERLCNYTNKFNDMGRMIAYAAKSSNEEHRKRIIDILVGLSTAQNAGQRKQLDIELEKLTNSYREARDAGLLQDQFMLNNLAAFVENFNPLGYEILITQKSTLQFRGIINRTLLRVSPQLISSLYGGQSELPWTMVGIVTHVQGTYQLLEGNEIINNPENPMMLDAYRNMFRKSRFFERMFLESNIGTEIVVSPLAIYREFRIITRQE